MKMFWPSRDEQSLLGRFYVASTLGEALALVQPFEFAYLFLVMERPDWAVMPFLVGSAVTLVLQVPAGLLADRWSRKKATLVGYSLSGATWAFIPLAVSLEGSAQLLAVCACFAVDGLGDALVSGAEDAWVVDNLKSARRGDLVDQFYARVDSFASFGGILAGGAALAVLLYATVDRAVLDLLWYVTALGQFVVVAIAATIAERRPGRASAPLEAGKRAGALPGALLRAGLIARARPLLLFTVVMVVASFADSIMEDAFVMSMITKGLDGRALAPLGMVEDLIGLIFPLIGLYLARRMGTQRFLALFLVIPALAASTLFLEPGLWGVVALCLLLDLCEVVWDPVAEARLQQMLPSRHRATLVAAVNQVNGLAEVAGYGVFLLILGKHAETLKAATPDLVDAFTGGVETIEQVPAGPFGLPLPDSAIVIFVFAGLIAVPLLLRLRQLRTTQD